MENIPKLSRAERRRLERENKKKATYCYSQEQIDSMIKRAVLQQREELVTEVTNLVLDKYVVLTMGVLYDKFDFDREQLMSFKNHLDFLSDCINEDYCTVEDYKLMLKEELGMLFHNSSYGDTEQPEIAESRAEEFKKSLIKDNELFMLICVLRTLRELFGFARTRGNSFIEGLNHYIEEARGSKNPLVKEWFNQLYTPKLFKEGFDKFDPDLINRFVYPEGGSESSEK